jgi:hypothetical protein
MKLIWMIKTCLKEMYSRVCTGKHLSDNFPIQNGLKQDALLPLLFNTTLEYAIRKLQDLREIEWDGMDWTDMAQLNTVMNLRVP